MFNSPQDQYTNDIKPDQTVVPYGSAISRIAWAPSLNQIFATSDWDGGLRILEVKHGNFGATISQRLSIRLDYPILTATWNDQSNQIYMGLMCGSIKVFDIGSGKIADIGKHQAPINSLHYVTGKNAIISTAYDNGIRLWQLGKPEPASIFNAEDKVNACDFQYPMLAAATASQRILLLDIENPNFMTIFDSADLGKGSQLQSIALNSKGTAYGIGSVDGRANISNFTKTLSGNFSVKGHLTFKSNKQVEEGITILYPINSASFNPAHQRWFMTAGADGVMHFWDYEGKVKIKSFSYGGIPITTAKVSPKGNMLAYGLGNDWHEGQENLMWQTRLGVHEISQRQTKQQNK